MECLYFQDWVIVEYLRSKAKLDSKDIELLVALFLNKFHENQWKCKCCIGLELKIRHSSEFQKNSSATLTELQEIMSKKIENNTLNDIVIAKQDEELSSKGYGLVRKGASYQIKRFGKNKNNKTNDLLQLLNNDYKQFSKTQTSLIIILETNQEIDFQFLQKNLNTNNYPFNKIMFVALIKNRLSIGEIWPNAGMDDLDINTLL